MQSTDKPTQLPLVFCATGAKNPVPTTTATFGQISLDKGFPPETMQPLIAGGTPPDGQDMNGVLNLLSQTVRWANAGGSSVYDGTFSAAIGGYPEGAVLLAADLGGFWLSTVENNTTNPDSPASGHGADWVPLAAVGQATQALTNANVALAATKAIKPALVLTGTLTGNVQVQYPDGMTGTRLVGNLTTGAFSVTVKTVSGAGVVVPQGALSLVYSDGSFVQFAVSSATETVRGVLPVATAAQAKAGTDDASIVTPLKLLAGVAVLSGNATKGSFRLGALIVNWGVVTGAPLVPANTPTSVNTGSFQTTFPTALLYADAVSADNSGGGSSTKMLWNVASSSTSDVTFKATPSDSGTMSDVLSMTYIAVGY